MAAMPVLGLLAFAPVATAASKVESLELPSRLVDTSAPGGELPDDRTVPKVNVLLPDGYPRGGSRKRRSTRRYPVLWLMHGAFGGADNWLGPNNDVRELAAGLPAIVVMPDGGRFGMYTDWWNRGDPAWASYHLRLVRRAVERRFRIRPGRRWHAIAGISMGGQGTLRYAAHLPGYFGTAVGFSSAFPDMQSEIAQAGLDGLPGEAVTYDAMFGPATGANAAGNSPQALASNYAHTRMYLTSGNGTNCPQDPPTSTFVLDGATETVINAQQGRFAAAVRAAGAEVTEVTTCGVHTFGVWDRAFAAARTWGLFEPVPERPRRWTYRTSAPAGEMWGLRFRFAKPPSTVAVFNRSGRVLTAAGRGSVRIRGGRGCSFSGELPLRRRLPAGCR